MSEEKVYCSMYSRNAELYHHGIQGQKWGIRNGPPYPLNSNVSDGKKLKVNNSKKGFIDPITLGITAMYTLAIASSIGAIIKAGIDEHRTQKAKANLGAQGKQAKEISDSLKNTKKVPDKYKKEGDPLVISKEELKSINPGYSRGGKGKINGATMNCTRCATAFILHKKGYLVEAASKYEGDVTVPLFKQCFNADPDIIKSRGILKETLQNKADGSYGAISFGYEGSFSGHIINWAKENGEIVIYDAQPGKKYTYSQMVSRYPMDFGYGVEFYDTTKSKINWNNIVKNEITK